MSGFLMLTFSNCNVCVLLMLTFSLPLHQTAMSRALLVSEPTWSSAWHAPTIRSRAPSGGGAPVTGIWKGKIEKDNVSGRIITLLITSLSLSSPHLSYPHPAHFPTHSTYTHGVPRLKADWYCMCVCGTDSALLPCGFPHRPWASASPSAWLYDQTSAWWWDRVVSLASLGLPTKYR